MYSPCVTRSSICGESFITDEEISDIKNGTSVNIENIKSRKYFHIQKYYYTANTMGFDENSNIFPGHKIVRIGRYMNKYKDLEILLKN